MSTLACSHIFSSTSKQGPELSEAIMDSFDVFQKRAGAIALSQESFQFSALSSPSSNRHLMASHKSWEASLLRECVIIVRAAVSPWFVLSPCWQTRVLCSQSGLLQEQLMGFAKFVTSKWQCLIEWTFSVSIIRRPTLLLYEKTVLNWFKSPQK